MRTKDSGVSTDFTDKMMKGMYAVDMLFRMLKIDLIVTSGKDGVHGENSLHPEGNAADIRIWHMEVPANFVWAMRRVLGKEFDVILEDDHIHMEYDPKVWERADPQKD